MNKKNIITLSLLITGSLLFNYFFWEQKFGLNLFLFNLFILGSTFYQKINLLQNPAAKTLGIASVLLTLLVLYHNSSMSVFTYLATIITFIGYSHGEKLKSLPYAYFESIINYFKWPIELHKSFKLAPNSIRKDYLKKFMRRFRLVLIPIAITSIFYVIFKSSNLIFSEFTNKWEEQITLLFESFLNNISIHRLAFYIWGLSITGWFVYKSRKSILILKESKLNDNVTRGKSPSRVFLENLIDINMVSLSNENKMGVVTLILVNLLLLIVNSIDVIWIWIKFDPTKIDQFTQFVHEGTYLLILSVLLSMIVLLHLFKKNQNFFPKFTLLRKLAFVWIIQNVILVISVGLRNFHYIQEYGLAYKRIGVFFFLTATVGGLITMFIKIRDKKSSYFLFQRNSWIVYACFFAMSTFNWEANILKYNLSHNKSVGFLVKYSDTILPEISQVNVNKFDPISIGVSPNRSTYLSEKLDFKILKFKHKYERTSWLSWNYNDYRTHLYFEEHEK